jgi:ADP-ribosyl-[dinitrogen reductase] hydrolase
MMKPTLKPKKNIKTSIQASWPQIEERAKSAFLGVAVGDALGATTEFMTPLEIQTKYGVHKKIVGGGWLRLKAGQVTDDTEMSLCIAKAIRDAQRWDLVAIADHFAGWMRSRPVDIGATCARGIRGYLHKGSLEVPQNEWDAGNGGVMRMAPVAIVTLGDQDRLEAWSIQQAHLTHNHPLSDAACIAVGKMVQKAMLGAPRNELRLVADDLVARYATFRFNPYLGNSTAYVVDTLQTVFHYLFSTESFEDCLIGVVNQGGDADTNGAVAGMIAGALYGHQNFPRSWLRKLDPTIRQETADLAGQLVRFSPLGSKSVKN